jgi:hypothetical protein
MAARIERELKKEIQEFDKYSRAMEKFTFVLFILTIVFIAVNLPTMLVELKSMATTELAALFISEVLLVIVIVYVAKTVLSR